MHSIKLFKKVIKKIECVLFSVTIIAIIVTRLYFILKSDFPLNDGGMFYSMILDLSNNNFKLPEFTTYNRSNIPFIYPPFSFYFATLLFTYTSISIINIIRFVPFILSIVSALIYYRFVLLLSNSKFTALLSLIIFGFSARGFEWIIVGGGLTRSFGQLFTMLAIYFCLNYCKKGENKNFVFLIISIGLTILSHPEWIIVELYSVILLFSFFYKEKGKIFFLSIYIYTIVALLTLPWWSLIILRNHASFYLNSFFTGSRAPISLSEILPFHGFVALSILAVLFFGILKFFIKSEKIGLFLITWLFIIFILKLRASSTHISIPLSLAISISINSARSSAYTFLRRNLALKNLFILEKLISLLVLISVSTYLIFVLIKFPPKTFSFVNKSDRTAMEWIKKNTRKDSTYLVISEKSGWWVDKVAEWFPALTGRKSVLTVQGSEWLGRGKFNYLENLSKKLIDCDNIGMDCIKNLTKKNRLDFSHIYISSLYNKNAHKKLLDSLNKSKEYNMLYEANGVSIWVENKQL